MPPAPFRLAARTRGTRSTNRLGERRPPAPPPRGRPSGTPTATRTLVVLYTVTTAAAAGPPAPPPAGSVRRGGAGGAALPRAGRRACPSAAATAPCEPEVGPLAGPNHSRLYEATILVYVCGSDIVRASLLADQVSVWFRESQADYTLLATWTEVAPGPSSAHRPRLQPWTICDARRASIAAASPRRRPGDMLRPG